MHFLFSFTVACPVGTYHNTSLDVCQFCSKGSYQDLEGQLFCFMCRPGMTSQDGATHETQCKQHFKQLFSFFHDRISSGLMMYHCMYGLFVSDQSYVHFLISLWKHAYSNILKISSPKTVNFPIKTSDIFHISAQNIDCGYSLEPWGSSNEYPQSMFLSRNKKNNVYPCKPQFYHIKVGFKVVKII